MRNALLALLGMMSISAYSWTEAETNMVGKGGWRTMADL